MKKHSQVPAEDRYCAYHIRRRDSARQTPG